MSTVLKSFASLTVSPAQVADDVGRKLVDMTVHGRLRTKLQLDGCVQQLPVQARGLVMATSHFRVARWLLA